MRRVVFVLALLALGDRSFAEPCPSLPDDPNCRKIFFIRDAEPDEKQPRNFRRVDTLFASGSAQPTLAGFQWIKENIPRRRLVVFDLRQESHGFYAGVPVSWYRGRNQSNCSKPTGQIAAEEGSLLAALRALPVVQPLKLQKAESAELCDFADSPLKLERGTVQTEEEVIVRLGAAYHRIYVPDFQAPEDWQVDSFVELAKGLRRAWVHFHCDAGDNRTATFLSMYDMMQNAATADADTILQRHGAAANGELLRLFHRYCREQSASGFAKSFSEWKSGLR